MSFKTWAFAATFLSCSAAYADPIVIKDFGVVADTTVEYGLGFEPTFPGPDFRHVYTLTLTERSDVSGTFYPLLNGEIQLDKVILEVNRTVFPAVVGESPWPIPVDPGADFPVQTPTKIPRGYSFSFQGAEPGNYMLGFYGSFEPGTHGFFGNLTVTPVPEIGSGTMAMLGLLGVMGLTRRTRRAA